ncbi:glycosyltransferase [Nodosilinea sp. PGN35]|uniref:glycosyltransferase family A protein n=1 Tax=Nodosilinea sp. PGN35 TaxID=3020489 RepID=UPI0023B29C88|nr:glycosyltransferase family A protein [Nodosilinea sp. TSF1-S3]MDF0367308.1 glycosyltransferase family A protein [Nodosilinea sp. TSF1-S3]
MTTSGNYRDVTAIIVAMTDREKPFLMESITSVFRQSDVTQVILCVDKENSWVHSTVGSLLEDIRLELLKLPLMPPGAIRNEATKYVKNPWLAYCDGDDVWCEEKICSQREVAHDRDCDFVGTDHYLTNEKGAVKAFALAQNLPMTSSWLVRTKIMQQFPFNESLYTGEDGEWWIRTENVIQKVRLPKMLIRYRVSSGSLSSATSSKKKKALIVLFSSVPVFGLSITGLTFFAWLFTRRSYYLWQPRWGNQPNA